MNEDPNDENAAQSKALATYINKCEGRSRESIFSEHSKEIDVEKYKHKDVRKLAKRKRQQRAYSPAIESMNVETKRKAENIAKTSAQIIDN